MKIEMHFVIFFSLNDGDPSDLLLSSEINLPTFDLIYLYGLICKSLYIESQ